MLLPRQSLRLQVVKELLRVTVGSNRQTDVLLNGQLELVPLRVIGRRQVDVGQRVQVDLVFRVRGEGLQTRLRDRQEPLGLDPRVDLVRSEEHTSELQSRPYLVCR